MTAYLIAALFGLILGSFVSMLTWRLPRQEDIIFRRSHCPNCQHPLSVTDLIPLLGGALQRWRCRHCRAPFSHYPAQELTVAALTVLAVALTSGAAELQPEALLRAAALSVSFAMLFAASVIDWRTKTLPEGLTIAALIFAAPLASTTQLLLALSISGGLLACILLTQLIVRKGQRRAAGFGLHQLALPITIGTAAALSPAGDLLLTDPLPGVITAAVAAAFTAQLNHQKLRRSENLLLIISAAAAITQPGLLAIWGAAALSWMVSASLRERYRPEQLPETEPEFSPFGFGDVPLLLVCALLAPPLHLLYALPLACVPVLIRARLTGERQVPFGPVLTLTTLIALTAGPTLAQWLQG